MVNFQVKSKQVHGKLHKVIATKLSRWLEFVFFVRDCNPQDFQLTLKICVMKCYVYTCICRMRMRISCVYMHRFRVQVHK